MRLFTVAFRAMSALGMRAIVLATLLTVASVATAGVERYNDPNPIPVPEGWSPEQVQAAIRRVLEEQDWVVVEEVTGRTHATLEARRRKVRVRADYDEKTVRFYSLAARSSSTRCGRDACTSIPPTAAGWMT